MAYLTIIMGVRNRAGERLERCLASLQAQTFQDFQAILVDYGSDTKQAIATHQIVMQFPFCQYVYSETRGYPWNRSRALNIGARLSTTEYVMTTDVDIIFPPNFLEIVTRNVHPERVLYCHPHYLPNGFQDWDNLHSYLGKLSVGNINARGGCQVIQRQVFFQLGGFDEYYQYWGVEDRDLHHRLMSLGLQELWLNDQTHIFHQWHAQADYSTSNFMPQGFWGRANVHYHRHLHELTRNDSHWGHIHRSDERSVFKYLDFEKQQLIPGSELVTLENQVFRNEPLSDFVRVFFELPSGYALAVNHAYFPVRRRFLDILIQILNKAIYFTNMDSRIDYNFNRLHSFVSEFIEFNPDLVADYYLGFPVSRGMSILVRA